MSYIPDFRGKENEKMLCPVDKEFLNGYRCAMEQMKAFFGNTDIYEITTVRKADMPEVVEEFREAFDEWCDIQETECVCSLFDNADYLTDEQSEKLIDHNEG